MHIHAKICENIPAGKLKFYISKSSNGKRERIFDERNTLSR